MKPTYQVDSRVSTELAKQFISFQFNRMLLFVIPVILIMVIYAVFDKTQRLPLFFISTLIALGVLLMKRQQLKRIERTFAKHYNGMLPLTYTFQENAIRQLNGKTRQSMELPFSKVKSYYENHDFICFNNERSQPVFLEKKGFRKGEPQDFKDWIKRTKKARF